MHSTLPKSDPQRHAVTRHFRNVSTQWGPRYHGRPKRMSDLDLQLRRENVRRLLEQAASRSGAPINVLDVGCGSGNVLDGLSRDAVRVFGLDMVPEMVRQAAEHHPADRFLVADAVQLPVRRETIDVATCLGLLEYLNQPQEALRVIWHALRPGGIVIVSFPNKKSLFRTWSHWETSAERTLLRCRDWLAGRLPADSGRPGYSHTQWSVESAKKLLEGAGFQVEAVRLQTFGLWGWIGRTRPALWLSRKLSDLLGNDSPVSRRLGCTAVLLARKPGHAHP
jgi:ubiquinone/menaquinone biosynthesis C-methylase UbiE